MVVQGQVNRVNNTIKYWKPVGIQTHSHKSQDDKSKHIIIHENSHMYNVWYIFLYNSFPVIAIHSIRFQTI